MKIRLLYLVIGILIGLITCILWVFKNYDVILLIMIVLGVTLILITWLFDIKKINIFLRSRFEEFLIYKILNPGIILLSIFSSIFILLIPDVSLIDRATIIILYFTGAAILLNTREVYIKNRFDYYASYYEDICQGEKYFQESRVKLHDQITEIMNRWKKEADEILNHDAENINKENEKKLMDILDTMNTIKNAYSEHQKFNKKYEDLYTQLKRAADDQKGSIFRKDMIFISSLPLQKIKENHIQEISELEKTL